MINAYLDEQPDSNLWMNHSNNQDIDTSPSRLMRSESCYSDNDDGFLQSDLLSSSRLLHRELRTLLSIFECYPAAPSSKYLGANIETNHSFGDGHTSIRDRTLETIILFAKEFGICPQLMDRVQCISIIGKEIRRSQNDPDWVCPVSDILVSFSQVYQIL